MSANFPQLDTSSFFSQSFWLLIFFLINFIFHSFLIIPFSKESVFGFLKKKNLLKENIKLILDTIEASEIQVEEIILQSKNLVSDIHLKAEEQSDQELLYAMQQIRESTNNKRRELKQSFSENKKNFIKTFSSSVNELSEIICSKMRGRNG